MSDPILINLNIISKISPSDKIYINGEGFIAIENSTILQGILRFLYSNSRSKSVHNLNNFYANVFRYIDNCAFDPRAPQMVSFDKIQHMQTLYLYLQKSIEGVQNLKKTYNTDVVMTSTLDVILDDIRQYLKKLDAIIMSFNASNNNKGVDFGSI